MQEKQTRNGKFFLRPRSLQNRHALGRPVCYDILQI